MTKRQVVRLAATVRSGMVNIDSEQFSYANIRNMYENDNGHGLQLETDAEHKRDEVTCEPCNSSELYRKYC